MTNPPAGWYPDPAPDTAPGRLRYWDGARWTEHLHDPAPQPPVPPAPQPQHTDPAAGPAAGVDPGPYPGTYGSTAAGPEQQAQAPYSPYSPYPQYPQYPQTQAQPAGVDPGRRTTPDGVPLSGWWFRVLARLLDAVVLLPLYVLAVTPVVASQWDELRQWWDDSMYAADHNLSSPPLPDLFDVTTGAGLALVLVVLAVNLVWEVLFLAWKQATPGKLILGLRVRRRDTPDLPWSSIVRRVGFVVGVGLLGQLPVLGVLFALVGLLDYLWPLWDGKNQALHDKVAGTNVVRPAKAPVTIEGAAPPPRW
jgi:uncharacterized RDD family membrane protein YckC